MAKNTVVPKPKKSMLDSEAMRLQIAEFLKSKNEKIAELQRLHAEYNKEFFEGALSEPLITIEKLSRNALACYQPHNPAIEMQYHIKFDIGFVALCFNDKYMKHIIDTLKHEMVHQWQHEVLHVEYTKRGKRIPKDWHTKDFKEKALSIGVPVMPTRSMNTGVNLVQIAAEISGELPPEEKKVIPKKSRNRKWQCGCGDSRTVWSTKDVNAICGYCNTKYAEC